MRRGSWHLCSVAGLALLTVLHGCATHRTPASLNTPPPQSHGPRHIDLQPGWRVTAIIPILRSGKYMPSVKEVDSKGPNITLTTTDDFLGYESARYAVRPSRKGGVEVRLESATVILSGIETSRNRSIRPLFDFPARMRHVRLIYMERASQSDHDMAIVAATDREPLERLTQSLLADSAQGCRAERNGRCFWVPTGIAVRPEIAGEGGQWRPAR